MALDELFAIKMTEDGDLELQVDQYGNKDLALVSGVDYLAQSARVRLTTNKGEFPLDADFGFPLQQAEGIFNQSFIEGSVLRSLKQDPDIREVTSVELTIDGRTRSVDVSVELVGEDGANVLVTVPVI